MTASDEERVQLSGDYMHTAVDDIFVYVKGPTNPGSGKAYYIDDFSLQIQGSPPVSFSTDSFILEVPVTDDDGDSVSNNIDNCPSAANTDQSNLDADIAGDACDDYPYDDTRVLASGGTVCILTTLNGTAQILCYQELGDADGDTVDNSIDNCPDVANSDQADRDSNSIGNACDVAAVEIPMIGGFGIFVLGLSMLGLGAYRVRIN